MHRINNNDILLSVNIAP